MATVVTGFLYTFEDLGLANAVIRKQDATKEELSSVFWFNLVFGWLLFGLIWLVTPVIVLFYQEQAVAQILRWSAASFLILPFSSQFQGLLRRDLRFKDRTAILLVNLAAYSCISISLAWLGFGAMSLVWATLSGTTISALFSVYIAFRSGWLPLLHFRWQDLSGYLKFGLYQSGGRILKYLSNNVDYLIIGRLLGAESLGYYTLAYNLMRLPMGYINPLVNTVAFPVFARVQDDMELLRRGYTRLLRYLSIATVPIMMGLFSVAHLLIPLVYGQQWQPSIVIVRIFAGLGILLSLNDPLESILMAKGRPDVLMYLGGLSTIGLIVGNWIGSQWGIIGVAISTLLVYLMLLLPIQVKLIYRFAGLDIVKIWSTIRTTLFASSLMMAVVIVLSFLLTSMMRDIPLLIILVLTGCSIYCLLLLVLDRPLFRMIMNDFELINFRLNIFSLARKE